ncbi:hypothetical protein JXO59_04745, partial [candidate division KSB1 bacterium]|nr:hypothetical protein [candidate division KSB1 bacterium]
MDTSEPVGTNVPNPIARAGAISGAIEECHCEWRNGIVVYDQNCAGAKQSPPKGDWAIALRAGTAALHGKLSRM